MLALVLLRWRVRAFLWMDQNAKMARVYIYISIRTKMPVFLGGAIGRSGARNMDDRVRWEWNTWSCLGR